MISAASTQAVGCFRAARWRSILSKSRAPEFELAIVLEDARPAGARFAAYEARKRLPERRHRISGNRHGRQPIGGKRILPYPEQGLGDVLLFVRFARELKRRGATVDRSLPGVAEGPFGPVDFIDHVVAEAKHC